MRLLVVLVLLAGFLSGCTDIGGSEGPRLASAQQALGPADRAAADWDATAQLLAVSAIEMDDAARSEAADELAEERADLEQEHASGDLDDEEYQDLAMLFDAFQRITDTPDDLPGDGLAPVWFFVYMNEAGDAYYAVAVSRGDVLFAQENGEAAEEFHSDEGWGALGDWSVDSDAAAEAGQLGNADYAALCTTKDVMMFHALTQGEDGPVWFIGAERQSQGEGPDEAFIAVDASTGSLVQDEVVGPVEELLFQESGSDEGRFTASVDVSQAIPFEIEDGRHLGMAVHVSVSPAPLQPVQVTVTDPMGATADFSIVAGEAPFFAEGWVFLAAPPGTYDITIEVPLAASMSYQASWCTDGLPTSDGDFRPRACVLMDESGGETLSRRAPWTWPW